MWVKAGGVPVWAEQCGPSGDSAARDVLLLHGWGCRIDTMAKLAAALAKDFRVTVIDFPGHGKSPEPPEPWSVTEYAAMTAEVICALGIAPCDVVAHSFGGRVTILLGSKYSDLIRSALITGGAGLIPKMTFKRCLRKIAYALFRAISRVLPGSDKIKARLAKRFGSSDYNALGDRMKKTFVRVVNQDLRPFLSGFLPPALLVWGGNDKETPLWFGQTMEKEMPDAKLVVFEGAGHFAFLEQSDRFAGVALAFLKGESA